MPIDTLERDGGSGRGGKQEAMKNSMEKTMNCKTAQETMLDLLMDAPVPAAMGAHLAGCEPCRTELVNLRETFAAMDAWTAPEPSPYFDSKLHVKLREAQSAEPEGFFERVRSYLAGCEPLPYRAGKSS